MTSNITVREHTRRKPDRLARDPFRDLIEARKAILAERMKPREQWVTSGWKMPMWLRSVADILRGK